MKFRHCTETTFIDVSHHQVFVLLGWSQNLRGTRRKANNHLVTCRVLASAHMHELGWLLLFARAIQRPLMVVIIFSFRLLLLIVHDGYQVVVHGELFFVLACPSAKLLS